MIKSKIDAREEAARLALASEAKDFTKKANEIYNFLTGGIELPDTYNELSVLGQMKEALAPTENAFSTKPKRNENKK